MYMYHIVPHAWLVLLKVKREALYPLDLELHCHEPSVGSENWTQVYKSGRISCSQDWS